MSLFCGLGRGKEEEEGSPLSERGSGGAPLTRQERTHKIKRGGGGEEREEEGRGGRDKTTVSMILVEAFLPPFLMTILELFC